MLQMSTKKLVDKGIESDVTKFTGVELCIGSTKHVETDQTGGITIPSNPLDMRALIMLHLLGTVLGFRDVDKPYDLSMEHNLWLRWPSIQAPAPCHCASSRNCLRKFDR
uniref:Uncharacterized protein n=2 Tax=Noccaea caerulescens TaxID=107243 RepID=A0A1J3GVU5_NOCCA